MFTITESPDHRLVDATLHGFFDLDTVKRYAAAIEPAIRRMARPPGGYLLLLDVSDCAIQSQQVIAAFQAYGATVPRARACALVTGTSAVRLQVRRVIKGAAVRLFDGRLEARAWLLDQRRPAAADGTRLSVPVAIVRGAPPPGGTSSKAIPSIPEAARV